MDKDFGQLLWQTRSFFCLFLDFCIRVYDDGEKDCQGRGLVKSMMKIAETFLGQLTAPGGGFMCTLTNALTSTDGNFSTSKGVRSMSENA